MKPILEIRNVSKKFFIDHERLPYLSMRDRISGVFKPKPKKEEFWALKDVSFNVMPGESIGIIGRNGAGKSTLLKILSRITPPTEGSITIRGRIASLLEVGTGFHQELTGRENIFMNGSILGMKNAEIKRRFDEIVDFSGVARFLDTPLKNYSSGMQLRLAFAVAAHLEPEILIVDEVLAVGDAEFQKKCLGKMEDVSREGRTILFVSHNISFVTSLCSVGVLLDRGKIIEQGSIDHVTSLYVDSPKIEEDNKSINMIKYTCDYFAINRIEFNKSDAVVIKVDERSLLLEVDFELTEPSVVELELHIKKHEEFVASYGNFLKHDLMKFSRGQHKLMYTIYLPDLLMGVYTIDLNFTHPMKKNLATLSNILLMGNLGSQIKMVMGNELRNWSRVIMNGEVIAG